MKKTRFNRFLRTTAVLLLTLCMTMLAGCGPKPNPGGNSAGDTSGGGNNPQGGNKTDAIVLMSEELSGLYNPFYATSGSDQDVVGMTQIGMLSTNNKGETVAGDNEPTVVKDFEYKQVTNAQGKTETVYNFVIKNGLKFSDGKPLTMNDVMFNMYEYLDPVYTGSSTMYSTKIKGLTQYRTQTNFSDGGSSVADSISEQANDRAFSRVYELVDVYTDAAEIPGSTSYSITEQGMRDAINEWVVSEGYKDAVATNEEKGKFTDADYRKILMSDYDLALKKYKTELENDYKAAKDAFDLTTAPYQEWASKFNAANGEIFKFFLYEGKIKPVYKDNMGKKDRTKIEKFDGEELLNYYKTQEEAINKVYNDAISSDFQLVLLASGTANELFTEFTAAAMDIYLHSLIGENGELAYPNIEGIVSLGHTTTTQSVTVNGKDYKVAHAHNDDGTPKNADEYDVLQITVEGTDPKAIYNFGFTVAPAHYYTADEDHPNGREIDIANNKFGVEYADAKFQSDVIQSLEHVEVPVGAGAYQASNANNDTNPKGSEFVNSNIVYYKRNDNFMFPVKTEKLRMQVVSASNAIDKLVSGEVHYVTPQFTKDNSNRLTGMKDQGYVQLSAWQLGYGYIGINAGKVKNIYIRRAIMAAMQTSLAKEFYAPGTCETIDWPMSQVNWAYPWEDDNKTSKQNGHSYTQWTGKDAAITKIKELMRQAGVSEGDAQLKITFTIAGASITEHPTYPVFKQAAEILNEDCGWDVEVKPDSQALTKLSTGSLAVWAAAWGSTIDPDMYQVYHKNSTATSVYAWGYREIKNDTEGIYGEEQRIINELSAKIDAGRETMKRAEREVIYEEAMGLVLDLAVEMPVYQRKTLYAYNANVIKGLQTEVNPYSSPLEKIWELELV